MREKISSTGNTTDGAEKILDKKREEILNINPDANFGPIKRYGNCEVGYKLVQEYSGAD